ncbi:MAG: aminotransferase class V-fold PLP-dependent enzyme [Desulfobacteraceae bacterium]|nr:MAG: aminotransferase class V-fold PLP-dependent enzyme [Desulfobacteraceae bacterium]
MPSTKEPLISPSEFIGLENIVHLGVGGEAPMLKSHRDAVERFFADKALGEKGREREDETVYRCKEKVARLLKVKAEEIAFLSSSSEGINLLVYGLPWKSGDNVVVCDVEFPSETLPWTRLQRKGVEIRIVRHRSWYIDLQDIERAIDSRTRLVVVSDVSYFTGQRLKIKELSGIVRKSGSLLCVDATHSAGAVSVEAGYADILIASCYKWLLAVHGTAIFYWNRDRLPDLEVPFLGWHSGVSIPDWQTPTQFVLRKGADRFEPGNVSFISIYILENALDRILKIGLPVIEERVLALSGLARQGLKRLGLELMTPENPLERAGNVCFMTSRIGEITDALAERGVVVWGGYAGVGRIRISTHLYNTEEDVDRLISAVQEIPRS